MSSIKKQLIVYRTDITHLEKLQSSRIHGLALKNLPLEYSECKRLNKVTGCQGRYIQQKEYVVDCYWGNNDAFLRLINGKNLKKVVIKSYYFQNSRNAHREIKYLTKQLCLRQKRINFLDISLLEQNHNDMKFFQSLSLLKNLKYLNLGFQERNHSINLQTFQKFLEIAYKRQHWPLLKLQVVRLSLNCSLSLQSNPDKNLRDLSQSLRNLYQITRLMSTKLEMNIPVEKDCNVETATYLSETLKYLSQTTKIKLIGKGYELSTNVLGKLSQYQNLQELFLYFSLGDQPEAEEILVQAFLKSLKECKSMKKFDMALSFTGNIIQTRLQTSHDRIFQTDEILIGLSDSLSSIKTLEYLKLEISFPPANKKIQTGISMIFSCIGSLKNLKELYLIFSYFGFLTDEELNTLCLSLRNLKSLYHLNLDLSNNQIKDFGGRSLEETLLLWTTAKEFHLQQ